MREAGNGSSPPGFATFPISHFPFPAVSHSFPLPPTPDPLPCLRDTLFLSLVSAPKRFTYWEMKTYTATPKDIEHRWFIVDADGMILGRLATEIARIIRGKHKPMFTPHMDTGDNVIVINASKVRVTGRKAEQKQYFRHTGYMGHGKFTPFATMLEKHPERIIEKAVHGMLPKSTLAKTRLRTKLRVYAGAEHPHTAQQPTVLNLTKSETA